MRSRAMDQLKSWVRAWDRFWFRSNQPRCMRAYRSALAWLLFAFVSIRTLDLQFFYTEKGIFPWEVFQAITPADRQFTLLAVFPRSEIWTWCLHFAYLASLLCLALGRWSRVAAISSFLLHLSFVHRNMSVVFGIDLIANFALFYLCFADYRGRSALGSVAYRFSQIQLCVIYFYSGVEKLKGTHWWRGEAIWDVAANSQLARMDFSWMASFPLAIVGLTYATLLWEIFFASLIWNKSLRPWLLAGGVALHAGIAFVVSLPFFGAIMVLSYLPFADPRWLKRVSRRFSLRRQAQESTHARSSGQPEPEPLRLVS